MSSSYYVRTITAETIARVQQARAQGKLLREVAKECGVSVSVACTIANGDYERKIEERRAKRELKRLAKEKAHAELLAKRAHVRGAVNADPGDIGWCVRCGREGRLNRALLCKYCHGGKDRILGKKQQLPRKKGRTPVEKFALDAGARGIVCTLSDEEYSTMLGQACVYCGATERIGVDRMDSLHGYVQGNCVPCCSRCNVSKGTVGHEDWMRVIAPARALYGDGKVWTEEASASHSQAVRKGRRSAARCARAITLLFASMAAFAASRQ